MASVRPKDYKAPTAEENAKQLEKNKQTLKDIWNPTTKKANPIAQAEPQQVIPQQIPQQVIPQQQFDIQGYLEDLAREQRRANQASLDKAYQSSLSNLGAERKNIQPAYYNARNQVSTGSQLGAKNLAEYMAQRGQTNSGASIQGEISRQGALQGNLGELNTAESNAFADIERRKSDLSNAYESDTAANRANVQQQLMQNLVSQYNTDRNYGLNEAQLTGMLNGNQTLSGRQFDMGVQDREKGLQDAALQKELDTISRYYSDFQAEINRRKASADTSDDNLIPYLEAARQQKIQDQSAVQYESMNDFQKITI